MEHFRMCWVTCRYRLPREGASDKARRTGHLGSSKPMHCPSGNSRNKACRVESEMLSEAWNGELRTEAGASSSEWCLGHSVWQRGKKGDGGQKLGWRLGFEKP